MPCLKLTSKGETDGGVYGAAPRRLFLYTSDAADDLIGVDRGGRCTIEKKTEYMILDILSVVVY